MGKEKPQWAKMLVDARQKEGFSSDSLAAALGFQPSTVRRAEAGKECSGVMKKLRTVLPDQASAILAEYNAYWSAQGRAIVKPDNHEAVTSTSGKRWLGVIKPNDTTRTYISIDDVMLAIVGTKVDAEFTRLYPRKDKGRTWSARGEVNRHGELRLFFDPSGQDRQEYDSSGCLLFTPRFVETSRMSYYKGLEIRGLDATGGREPDVRECDLYPPGQLPSEYMPAFAVLDLDNTLFKGWSILRWVSEKLYMHGLKGTEHLREALLKSYESYSHDQITHDEFALSAAAAYIEFYNQNGPTKLRQAASSFADAIPTQAHFYDFAADLVQTLRQALVAPVLITGAPQELADELARVIGITEVYGFDVSSHDEPNPGTAEGKMQLAHEIAERTARSLQFAAGDSESDALVLEASPVRLIAGKLLDLHPDLNSGGSALEFDEETSSSIITNWVRTLLPELALSRREGEAQALDN